MIGAMPLSASQLPTLASAPTLGNQQAQASDQARQLAALLAQYQQSQDQMALGQEMQGADYIPNSGSLGVLAAIANKYMGGRIRRKEGEKAGDLTQRILQAQNAAEAQKLIEEQNRKTAEQRADYQRKLEILRSGDANAIAAAGLKAPEQQKQEFQFYDSADGPVWIPKPNGIGADVLPQMEQSQGLDFDSMRAAVEQVESGGNPNAVSPKGAVGRMQTMPGTLADPGFGVTPARDGSDAELTRVGTDYLQAMLNKYADPRLALAAYNWGPGNVDEAMQRSGGDIDAVIASAPKETQDYVRKVGGLAGPRSGMDAIPIRGVRPKPKDGERDSFRMATPEEIEAAGLPTGSSAQINTTTNRIDLLNKPDARQGTGGVAPLSAGEAAKVRTQFKETKDALNTFKAFDQALADVPNGPGLLLDGDQRGRLGTAYNNARAALRIVYNTGVLQPGELPMLESALRDPNSVTAIMDPRTRPQIQAQLDELYRAVAKSIDNQVTSYPQLFNQQVYEQRKSAGAPQGKYSVGQVIDVGGKRYRVTGGDMNDPDVEEVR